MPQSLLCFSSFFLYSSYIYLCTRPSSILMIFSLALFVQLLIFVPAFAVSSLYFVVAVYRDNLVTYLNCVLEMNVHDTPIIRNSLIVSGSPWNIVQTILKSTFGELTYSNRTGPGNVDKLTTVLVMSSVSTIMYIHTFVSSFRVFSAVRLHIPNTLRHFPVGWTAPLNQIGY